jgi:stringent starvation protein B
MTQLLPPKKEVALALLERSNVDIYLDPRAEGVVVPPQFRKEPRLILKIGLNMPVPIPDLRLDDESMSCTLSFNRAKFFCVVPWLSVFAMVGDDGRGMVWPDDVPQELAAKTPPGAADAPAPPSSRGGGRGKPRLAEEPESERGPKKSSRGGASKKKKDEAPARPMLHAVPNPPASSPRLEKVPASVKVPESQPRIDAKAEKRERESERERQSEREEKAAPAPAPRPAATTNRPKRELPPYLRVVK